MGRAAIPLERCKRKATFLRKTCGSHPQAFLILVQLLKCLCRPYVQMINQVCTKNVQKYYHMCMICIAIDCTDWFVYTDAIAHGGVIIWIVQNCQFGFCTSTHGVLDRSISRLLHMKPYHRRCSANAENK